MDEYVKLLREHADSLERVNSLLTQKAAVLQTIREAEAALLMLEKHIETEQANRLFLEERLELLEQEEA